MKQSFPKIITDLPEADIEIKGARGWMRARARFSVEKVFSNLNQFPEVIRILIVVC